MPAYEYACRDCGAFQASRPMTEYAEPNPCPACGALAPRAPASPHVRTAGSAIRYIAETRNEKSANEPPIEHRIKGTTGNHLKAHSHLHHGHATNGRAHAATAKRPWMIGH